jgi:aerobic carbon-monoxide dehydrogenase small subunit
MRIALTVNGRTIEAEVAPRTSLADFLREHLLLTGTHTGCEHGICGACTVEIGGEIARSCITYAVACDGASVRTIEGFDDDALMERLRRAFTEAHALQCGYCTPGMLIAARDLVRRKGDLSRQQIRHEMSGNLCRCTGYMGIVDAVARVMGEGVRPSAPAKAGADTVVPSAASNAWLGPAPGPVARASSASQEPAARAEPAASAAAATAPQAPLRAPIRVTTGGIEEEGGTIRLSQSFVLEHPLDAVWALMSNPEAVASCMPGAQLDGPPQEDRISGRIEVKLGPVVARFSGAGTVTRLPSEFRQIIEGHGVDRKGGSRVSGRVDTRLTACRGDSGGEATHVDVVIGYALTGLLAQLGRSGLARSLAQRIGESFAQNLDTRLCIPSGAAPPVAGREQRLGAMSLLLAALRDRVRALLAGLRRA